MSRTDIDTTSSPRHRRRSPEHRREPGDHGAGTEPRLGLLLVVMCSALALVVAATSSLALAVPDVAQQIGATQVQTTWIVNAYALVFAALLLPVGIAADRFGRRGFLVAGLVVFGAATTVSGYLDDPWAVVALRGVAGLGAAAVMPATLSVLVDAYPPERRERAVSVWAAVSGAGAMVGLLASGSLLDHFWWGSVQVASGIAAGVVALACLVVVPASSNPDLRLDPLGALLSLVGLSGVMFAVIQGPDSGWSSVEVLTGAAIGVVAVVSFVVHELRSPAPMLDVRLFRSRLLSTGSGLVLIQFLAAYAFFLLAPQWLQYLEGQTPLEAALWFLPFTVGIAPASALAPPLIARLGPGLVGAAGMVQMAAALGLMAWFGLDEHSLWWFAAAVVLFAFGFGLTGTPGTSLIIDGLPEDRRTLSAAVNDVTREVGGALGGAIAASVLLAAYAGQVRDVPGLPSEAADVAGEGFVQAVTVARDLPPDVGRQLVEAARDAFSNGYATSLGIAAGALVVGAVLTLVGARAGRRQSTSRRP
jgi:EmrB/QacA subfamily drug resistance transporter